MFASLRVQHTVHKLRGKTKALTERGKKKSSLTCLILKINDLNWVENLPEYRKLYNESPPESLGFLTPFEVYFGRPSNRPRNKLCLGEKGDFEVPEENVDETNYDNPTELEEGRTKQLSKCARCFAEGSFECFE